MEKNKNRGQWSSGIGFVLAAAGSAIGLGNIWKFPYIAGVHGGGAFVLVYLFCVVFIGFSIMLAEFIIGRHTQLNPIGAMKKLQGKGDGWSIIGWLSVITPFIILTYYSVVAGWVIDYIWMSVTGTFSVDHSLTLKQNVDAMQGTFGSLLGNGGLQTIMHFIFTLLTVGIVVGGVRKGIEKVTNILMPLLFVMLIGLFVYSFFMPGSGSAWEFLFNFKFDKLTPAGILEALGQAFFTLSLGMGAMITYASYLSREQSIVKTGFQVIFLDTIIALVSGIIIFSIVFTFNFEPGSGPGLLFSTLPPLFAQIPGGGIISTIFFLLVLVAALTSSVSLFEVPVSFFVDNFQMDRKKVSIIAGIILFVVGLLNALSYNVLSGIKFPTTWIFGEDVVFFDLFDKISSNLLLPLGGLLISIYVGWAMAKKIYDSEFKESEKTVKVVVKMILKFVAPIVIMLVFLNGLGIISFEGPEVSQSQVVLDITGVEDTNSVYYIVVGNENMLNNGAYSITKENSVKYSHLGIKKADKNIDFKVNSGTYDIAVIKLSNYGSPFSNEAEIVSVDNADNLSLEKDSTITVSVDGNTATLSVVK